MNKRINVLVDDNSRVLCKKINELNIDKNDIVGIVNSGNQFFVFYYK